MDMIDFSGRLLAPKAVALGFVTNISPTTIHKLLKKTRLLPWQHEHWCLPSVGGEFVAAMEDVLDLYEEDYNPRYPTACLDEKPVVLHADVQPHVPVEPGRTERVDYEYERRGTRILFVLVESLAGWRHVEVTEQRTMQDYVKVVHWLVDEVYPHAEYIRLVQDKPPHAHPSLPLRNLCASRSAPHSGAAWSFITHRSTAGGANMAEIEIAILERNALSRRLPDEAALRRQVRAVETKRNQQHRGIAWQFTRARCARQAGAALSHQSTPSRFGSGRDERRPPMMPPACSLWGAT